MLFGCRAIGVMTYTMLYGKPPFETKDVKTTYELIRNGQYSFPDAPEVSAAAKDLMTQLLR